MGRRAQGASYRIQGGMWCVRFRVAGKRHELSTGVAAAPGQKRPSEAAVREGEQLYAAALQGKRIVRAGPARVAQLRGLGLAEAFAEWLEDCPFRAETRKRYQVYAVQWLREWSRVADMGEAALASYFRRRLREVQRKAAQNESSTLRSWARWAHETGLLDAPLVVPRIPKDALGTPTPGRHRTRAPELSPTEVEGILALLPEWSGHGYAVKARFEVMFDTTLRPATLDRLEVPRNWAPGETVIRIEAADDKEGAAREVPLTPRAQAALARVAPASGPIFGHHHYYQYLRPAAAAVLAPSKASIFCGQHVRSAAITRALERSGNLPGVMHHAGHQHAATTSRYVRPSFRAALDVMRAISGEATPKGGLERANMGDSAPQPSIKPA
jgi:hypothetical protein